MQVFIKSWGYKLLSVVQMMSFHYLVCVFFVSLNFVDFADTPLQNLWETGSNVNIWTSEKHKCEDFFLYYIFAYTLRKIRRSRLIFGSLQVGHLLQCSAFPVNFNSLLLNARGLVWFVCLFHYPYNSFLNLKIIFHRCLWLHCYSS